MEKFSNNFEENSWQEIATEILAMAKEDEKVRSALKERDNAEHMVEMDQRNTARIKEIVSEKGWPKISEVGEEVAHRAWLLVQHADLSPDFQAIVLDKMLDLGSEVYKKDVAYLIDRLLVNLSSKDGAVDLDLKYEAEIQEILSKVEAWVTPKLDLIEPLPDVVVNADHRGVQIYGSQFTRFDESTFGARPILDRARVNARRAEVGLGRFEVYEKEMKDRWAEDQT